jgi:hypothetical protein
VRNVLSKGPIHGSVASIGRCEGNFVLAARWLLHHVNAHVSHIQTLVDARFFRSTPCQESLEKTFLGNSIEDAAHDVSSRGSSLLNLIFVWSVL